MAVPTRKADLRLLIGGRFITTTGSLMQMAILPLYILDLGGTAATMGTFLFASMMPMMLLAPFAGVHGDRHNRKRIMVSSDLISAVLAALLWGLAISGLLTLPILFLIQALLGISQIYFETATGGMVPHLVPRDELATANSKIAAARVTASIVGPVLGANLYVFIGIDALFALNAVSFLLSAGFEAMIRYRHTERADAERRNSVLTDLKQGMAFIAQQKLILSISLFFALITLTIGPVMQLIVPLVFKSVAQLPDSWYGYVQNFGAVGGLIGAAFAGGALKRFGFARNFAWANGVILIGLVALALVADPSLVRALADSQLVYFLLLGASLLVLTSSFAFISIPVQTLIQQETPPEYLSRVYALVGLISKGGMPVGAYVYGLVLAKVAVHQVIWLTALAMLPLLLAFSRYLLRRPREAVERKNEDCSQDPT